MRSLLNNLKNLNVKKNIILCLILFCCISCEDNATNLAKELESASGALQFEPKGTEYIINYRPVYKWTKPYVIILIPEREVTLDQLIQEGLDGDVGYDIFSSLGYMDVGYGDSLLIVYQEGEINFTGYFGKFVKFSEIKVIEASGSQKLVVKKIDNSESKKVNVSIEKI